MKLPTDLATDTFVSDEQTNPLFLIIFFNNKKNSTSNCNPMNIQNFMFQSNFLYSGQVINYKLVINYFSLITYANTKRALIFSVLGLFPCDKTKPY